MKPAPFRYVVLGTVDEVLGVLKEHGADARGLAGGQSPVPKRDAVKSSTLRCHISCSIDEDARQA